MAAAGPEPEVMLESTYGCYWAADLLQDLGGHVDGQRSATTRGTDGSSMTWRTQDLVTMSALGRLAEGWIAPAEVRELRELVRYRYSLIRHRTSAKAQIHGVMAKNGKALHIGSRQLGHSLGLLCKRSPVLVRIRTDSDLAKCVVIARPDVRLDGYPVYLPTSLHRFIASPDALGAWVAEEDGEVIGHVALHQRSSDVVLALAAENLNQPPGRLGVIARLLVARRLDEKGLDTFCSKQPQGDCLRRGLYPILDVVTEHVEAIRLYEHEGWICVGQVTTKLRSGHVIEELVFRGPINA